MLFFTKIADDTVARAFTFESAKRVVERFVFSDSDSRHIHNPPLPERRLMITRKLYQTNLSLSSDFGGRKNNLFRDKINVKFLRNACIRSFFDI